MVTHQDELWISSSGKVTAVGDLHPEHMRNIIRQFIRNRNERYALFEALAERDPKLVEAFQARLMEIESE